MSTEPAATQNATPDASTWRGRRVLVTGHTGFMGGWLVVWLHQLGAQVSGLALPPPSRPSFYEAVGVRNLLSHESIADIRDAEAVAQAMRDSKPEILFHLAAQPIVREAFANPVETFGTNVLGTVHVMEALRSSPDPQAALIVTSDKVYDNQEGDHEFSETDRLGGKEAYGSSKACVELVVDCYRSAYLAPRGTRVATIRAGNVIGGGDWAKERLLPDIFRAFSEHHGLVLRHPESVRPWQHVAEPLRGYLLLAERMTSQKSELPDGAWNFGPRREDHKTVAWIAEHCAAYWGEGAEWSIQHDNTVPEAGRLAISSDKAAACLAWAPRLGLEAALKHTIAWYKGYLMGAPLLPLTEEQISEICG